MRHCPAGEHPQKDHSRHGRTQGRQPPGNVSAGRKKALLRPPAASQGLVQTADYQGVPQAEPKGFQQGGEGQQVEDPVKGRHLMEDLLGGGGVELLPRHQEKPGERQSRRQDQGAQADGRGPSQGPVVPALHHRVRVELRRAWRRAAKHPEGPHPVTDVFPAQFLIQCSLAVVRLSHGAVPGLQTVADLSWLSPPKADAQKIGFQKPALPGLLLQPGLHCGNVINASGIPGLSHRSASSLSPSATQARSRSSSSL